MAALEWRRCSCANCAWRGTEDQTQEVRDFWSRIEPGDTMPAGDCPECGCFAFLDAVQACHGPVAMVRMAVSSLKDARGYLAAAGAPRTLERVRRALKSADGALRHAQGMAARQTRAAS